MKYDSPILAFENAQSLHQWLAENHDQQRQLYVQIYKKGSGVASIDWDDLVVAALAWGWIDGQKRSHDEKSYLQRITPRRAGSGWSKRNVDHVERLIAEGTMTPHGLAHVAAAKADGRWAAAYAGPKDLVIPDDCLEKLSENPSAQLAFNGLKRAGLYTIYHRLHTAKQVATRQNRMAVLIERLAKGVPL